MKPGLQKTHVFFSKKPNPESFLGFYWVFCFLGYTDFRIKSLT